MPEQKEPALPPQGIPEQPGISTGFLETLPNLLHDFVFGGETAVPTSVRNAKGDWRPQAPDFKGQLMKGSNGVSYGETDACMSFSGTNDLATQMDWLILNGQIDPNAVNFLRSNGYFGADGKLNFAPRFTAKMSGTDPARGNSFLNVWGSMRHDGVVPDGVWPMPTKGIDAYVASQHFVMPTPGSNNLVPGLWDLYYAQPSQEAIDLGKQFASWFDVQYEWVSWVGAEKTMGQLANALLVSPLNIATAVCQGWNTANPIQACGDGSQHATTLLNIEPGVAYDILDHYSPFMKRFAAGYSISYAVRGVVTVKPQVPPPPAPPFTYEYTVRLTLGAPVSVDLQALQKGLQTVKDKNGVPYMKPGVFGPFGPQTEDALGRFQVDHGIADAPQGGHFGPQSQKALTQALKDLSQ